MDDLQKEILLELYKTPGVKTNLKSLLLSLNPEKGLLIKTLRYFEQSKIVISDNQWRAYSLCVAGKENEIKDCNFYFTLTIEGERLVRERYLQPKQSHGGFSGNVIGDNFHHNIIVIGNDNKTELQEDNSVKVESDIEICQNEPNKNKLLEIIKKYWWGLVIPVIGGLIVWWITQ